MAFKAFDETDIQPNPFTNKQTIPLSEDSACANHVHFFTGIRSLGKLGSLESGVNPAFGLQRKEDLRYQFKFSTEPLPGQSITAEKVTGVFISSADQTFQTSVGSTDSIGPQSIFNHVRGYLYRPDNAYDVSSTALSSASNDEDISVLRLINIRRDIVLSSLRPASFGMEMNLSNTSLSGAVNGPSAQTSYSTSNVTGYTTALDLKNPYNGEEGASRQSFFAISTSANPYVTSGSLDSITDGITIEAIIRPYRTGSTIFFRRIASSADSETRDKFLKMELTESPDGKNAAFRFYIRNTAEYASNTDSFNSRRTSNFSEDFADVDVQASGLFVPADAGINLFDGEFHHLVVTWSIYELGEGNIRASAERGTGVVLGYIDGYKLLNKEQVFPRLQGSDEANGPVPQANMLEQRIPIRTTRLQTSDSQDSPSGNNVYIGVSNYNRANGIVFGDRGAVLSETSANLAGLFEGQIQHVRVWNQRLKDGTTGYKDGVNQKLYAPSLKQASGSGSLGLTFQNFYNATLTSTSAAQCVGWWRFNEINSISAVDIIGGMTGTTAAMAADPYGNISSNTGSVVGNGKVKLYDAKDITLGVSGNSFTDASACAIVRTFLYYDQPQTQNPINNDLRQGRVVRKTIENTIKKVGMIFYDSAQVVLDGDDENARMQFTWPSSGVTGDFGFAVTGNNNTAFNVERIKYDALEDNGRLILDVIAAGDEFNYTDNTTGKNSETQENIFDTPTSFITTVGLYNDNGDLLAISKLSRPVKKDHNIQLTAQIKLDF